MSIAEIVNAGPGQPVQLSAFEVSTKQDEGYRSNNSASGNKTGTAIRETPQSIQIVNQSFIDDLQARSVADALVYTSGLTEGQNSRGDRFEIRGFTKDVDNIERLAKIYTDALKKVLHERGLATAVGDEGFVDDRHGSREQATHVGR